jgi:hypothetical protein
MGLVSETTADIQAGYRCLSVGDRAAVQSSTQVNEL